MDTALLRTAAVAVVALTACVLDVRTRKIPNALTLTAALTALVFQTVTLGASGLLLSLGGMAVGLVLLLPWFAVGGMGAGDVKLLAALGAWLGPASTLWVGLYAAVAGLIMDVAVALSHHYLRTAVRNVWTVLGWWRLAGFGPAPEMTLESGRGPRLPYAVPLAAGVLVRLWLH